MINETRNELLTILNMNKNGENSRDFYTKLLLERFMYDLQKKEEELNRQLNELKENKELLDYVAKELGIEKLGVI